MSNGYEGGTPPPDGPRNLAGVINGTNIVVFALSWISVLLRVISRVWISHNFGWDDAMMVFCQMTNSVGMGLVIQETFWGLGRHRFYLKTDNFIRFLKFDYLDWCQVFITLMTCKLAICMFLLRISKFKQWRLFIYGLMAFLVLTHIPLTFIYIFQCRPVNFAWEVPPPPGVCWSKATIQDIIIVQGVCSIVTDVICAAFPIILIRNMRLPSRQKLALQLLMGLGMITALITVVRTVFSYQVKAEDKTWQGVPNALCRIFEINLGIVAANAPMMRPLWNFSKRKWRAKFRSTEAPVPNIGAAEMQFYTAPTAKPWYKRFGKSFNWTFRPPVSQTSSTERMKTATLDREVSPEQAEKVTLPAPAPHVKKSIPTSDWPQHFDRDRPENATWAKDEPEQTEWPLKTARESHQRKVDESFDLPMQGTNNREWIEEERERMREWGKDVNWGGSGNYSWRRNIP